MAGKSVLRFLRRIACCGLLVACSGQPNRPANGSGSGTAVGSDLVSAPRPTLTLFALAELRGQIEPCGCTTDPLGDLARTAKVVADARAQGPVLMVDAGSTLYSKNPVPAVMASQENLKADLIATAYRDLLDVSAVGLGPADLSEGPARTRLPRQVANIGAVVPAGLIIEPAKTIDVGGVKVGVFGVTAPDAIAGITLDDPVAAAKRSVTSLRAAGAQIVVGLINARSKKDALQIVRDAGGIDLSILGLGGTAPEPADVHDQAEAVGDGWFVVPGNRGQVLTRLDITVRPGGGVLVDAIGPAAAQAQVEAMTARLAALDSDLAAFAKDQTADPTFIATKQRERAAAASERQALLASPWRVPATGSYFALTQVRIDKGLACDAPMVAAKSAFDVASGAANVAAAKAAPPPAPVPKGIATYVGSDECANCHVTETEFWRGTKHAGAWKTLVDADKEFDADCISCHVTGWDRPGGATMANNERLRDVQCETCHGPGSLHVDADGTDKPLTVKLAPEPALCATQCHTKEHSDTFQFEAYMRDVVGKGHGAERRAALGDGPTGLELRQAGFKKAAKVLGPGCSK